MAEYSRPHVIVNMAMSLDGRITTRRREQMTLGSAADRRLMDLLRSRADAVIVGAGTVRADGYAVLVRDAAIRARRGRRRGPHPVNVVLSRELNLPIDRGIFRHEDTTKIIFTTSAAPATRVARFGKIAEVVVLRGRTLSPGRVLENLASHGMKKVLLEGGGEINFAFAAEGLIDEIYVTLTPRLIGGTDAPSILDGRGFLKNDHIQLELVSSRRVDNELFLRYRVAR